jgi:hypothetical protein
VTATTPELAAFLDRLDREPDCATTLAAYQDYCGETGRVRELEHVRLAVDIPRLEFEIGCSETTPSGIAGGIRAGCEACYAKHRLATLRAELLALPCPGCGGRGKVPCHICGSQPGQKHAGPCSAIGDRTCPTCGGSGDLLQQRQWNPDYQEYQPATELRLNPTLDLYAHGKVCVVRTVPYPVEALGKEMVGGEEYRRAIDEDRTAQTMFIPAPGPKAVAEALPFLVGLRGTGREPYRTSDPDMFIWYADGRGDDVVETYSHHIPGFLWDRLEGWTEVVNSEGRRFQHCRGYDTPEAAHHAAAVAALALVRGSTQS